VAFKIPITKGRVVLESSKRKRPQRHAAGEELACILTLLREPRLQPAQVYRHQQNYQRQLQSLALVA